MIENPDEPPKKIRKVTRQSLSSHEQPASTSSSNLTGNESIGSCGVTRRTRRNSWELKRNSEALSLAEAMFVEQLQKNAILLENGDVELKTSTPSASAPVETNFKKRGRKKKVASPAIASFSQSEITDSDKGDSVAGNSKLGDSLAGDNKQGDSITDDSKQGDSFADDMERSGRRKKCTSARVLLGLVKGRLKEMRSGGNAAAAATAVGGEESKPKKEVHKIRKIETALTPETHSEVVNVVTETPTVGHCSSIKPEWLKPFKLGWRREIVFRNTMKSPASLKPSSDVYYFAPDDTKLRSVPQIMDYLKNTKYSLTSECFTFTKSRIYKEPSEVVRSAAFARGRTSRKSVSTTTLDSNETSCVMMMTTKDDDDNDDDSSSNHSPSVVDVLPKTKRSLEVETAKEERLSKDRETEEKTTINDHEMKRDVDVDVMEKIVKEEEDVELVEKKNETKTKKDETLLEEGLNVPPQEGSAITLVEEKDKRQAVRAAASLALRTYMSHALRSINNPLLQSTTTASSKTTDKEKSILNSTKSSVKQETSRKIVLSPSPSKLNAEKLKNLKTNEKMKTKFKSNSRARDQSSFDSKMKKSNLKSVNADVAELHSAVQRSDMIAAKKQASLYSTLSLSSSLVEKSSSVKSNTIVKDCKVSLNKITKLQPSDKTFSSKIKDAVNSLLSSSSSSSPSLGKYTTSKPKFFMNKSIIDRPAAPPVGEKKQLIPVTFVDFKKHMTPTSFEKKSIVTPILTKPTESFVRLIETTRVCGMECPGRLFIPPTMNCSMCMCLYHPECAGYSSYRTFAAQMDFTCWSCRKLKKELENTTYQLNIESVPNPIQSTTTTNQEKPLTQKKKTLNVNDGRSPSALDIRLSSSSSATPRCPGDVSEAATTASTPLMSSISPSEIIPLLGSSTTTVQPPSEPESSGPCMQLLVIPLTFMKHLNLTLPLILLPENTEELYVKPDEMCICSTGLHIRLPLGSLNESLLEGPEKPLEFRIISTAADDSPQIVSVSRFEWPRKEIKIPTKVRMLTEEQSESTRRRDRKENAIFNQGKNTEEIKKSEKTRKAFDKNEGGLKKDTNEVCKNGGNNSLDKKDLDKDSLDGDLNKEDLDKDSLRKDLNKEDLDKDILDKDLDKDILDKEGQDKDILDKDLDKEGLDKESLDKDILDEDLDKESLDKDLDKEGLDKDLDKDILDKDGQDKDILDKELDKDILDKEGQDKDILDKDVDKEVVREVKNFNDEMARIEKEIE